MSSLSTTLTACLDDLARRIDEAEEERVQQAWVNFLENRCTEAVFVPPGRVPKAPQVDWPKVVINDALHDPQLMVLDQLRDVSNTLANGGGNALCVRCNYGVSIMTSQLGCEVVEMPREQGNTPTTLDLGHGGDKLAAIHAALDRGVPDHRAGQGAQVFDTGELFLEIFERWPVLGRWVWLYHPDTQGPMDNAELAWGSDIFMAFYDEPGLVHRFLDLMTEHYLAFLRKWFALVRGRGPYSTHWGLMIKGQIVLRDDSLMNLSPEIYREFIKDREAGCLRELGGGMIHFCGRGDHFIADMSELRSMGLTAINMSQPHLNTMETIYQQTVDRGLMLIGFNGDWAQKAIDQHRPLRGRVQCQQLGSGAASHFR